MAGKHVEEEQQHDAGTSSLHYTVSSLTGRSCEQEQLWNQGPEWHLWMNAGQCVAGGGDESQGPSHVGVTASLQLLCSSNVRNRRLSFSALLEYHLLLSEKC